MLLEFPRSTFWEYSSGSSNLLSGALRNTLQNDQEYWNFPHQELFAPLNMNSMRLEADPEGNYVASSYSWATAIDWAKYGQLYLNDGVWNVERILPEGWVDYTREAAEGSDGIYGAQFWLHDPEKFPDVPTDMYFADGFQGQRIFIVPSKDLVVVRLGLSKFEQPDYNKLLKEVIASTN